MSELDFPLPSFVFVNQAFAYNSYCFLKENKFFTCSSLIHLESTVTIRYETNTVHFQLAYQVPRTIYCAIFPSQIDNEANFIMPFR